MKKQGTKKKNVAVLEMNHCKQCPFLKKERYYTSDSFEHAFDWFCKKKGNKKIAGYVEWNEEKDVIIPDWCPIIKK